jgi:nitroimidazol reductase NimA-like FMN-containing flavoprotein (pyridoxamine 5'-phosphate oxidase superfamily)
MTDEHDPAPIARAIIDAHLYMVLGTVDQAGRPWVSPVYYAPAEYREFFWVSSPDATHSRNLEARRDVSIVIFDSSVPIGTGQAVYMTGVVDELSGDECERGIEVFSRRSLAHGGREWTVEDVRSPARHRLYRATAAEHFVLDEHDSRVPVTVAMS